MMKKHFLFTCFFLVSALAVVHAQKNVMPPKKSYRVAIFAPLYLDSLFTEGNLANSKSIPRFAQAGLDFVQGAMIALDTLPLGEQQVEARIYDSKADRESLPYLIKNRKLDGTDLIIGSVKEPEYSYLASLAQITQTPFVSATYPNDGGIRQNPFLFIVNPTLKAHVDGICSYLLQKHGTDNIYLFKQKNDSRIDNFFKAANTVDGKKMLNIRTIALDSSVSAFGLRQLIDTSKNVVIIGASLDETFASQLADAIYPVQKNNRITYIGMPNWDEFRSFSSKNAYPDFPIYFTSAHADVQKNVLTDYLETQYFQKYRVKPSEMAYKGFESAWYFTKALLENTEDYEDAVNNEQNAPFHKFFFRPSFSSKTATEPDYFENKHLFVMKILNGSITQL